MTALPNLTAKKLLAILQHHKFEQVRQKGSHVILRHADGRRTTVPVHAGKTIGKGLLRKIMHDTDLTVEDLL